MTFGRGALEIDGGENVDETLTGFGARGDIEGVSCSGPLFDGHDLLAHQGGDGNCQHGYRDV